MRVISADGVKETRKTPSIGSLSKVWERVKSRMIGDLVQGKRRHGAGSRIGYSGPKESGESGVEHKRGEIDYLRKGSRIKPRKKDKPRANSPGQIHQREKERKKKGQGPRKATRARGQAPAVVTATKARVGIVTVETDELIVGRQRVAGVERARKESDHRQGGPESVKREKAPGQRKGMRKRKAGVTNRND